MQEIFDKIKGREWDWFELPKEDAFFFLDKLFLKAKTGSIYFSLADLLANKSWCKAVWGDDLADDRNPMGFKMWHMLSRRTFEILQEQGHDAAIEYIKSTMV